MLFFSMEKINGLKILFNSFLPNFLCLIFIIIPLIDIEQSVSILIRFDDIVG